MQHPGTGRCGKNVFNMNTIVLSLRNNTITATRLLMILGLLALLSAISLNSFAVTKTAATTGNWSNPAIWSPAGVPDSTDDIIIKGNKIITIDGTYIINNLDLGDNDNHDATLKIIAAGDSLTIKGDLRINPNNKDKIYTLDAGPGVININGTFSHWSTTGDNYIRVGRGGINIVPAVTITDDDQFLKFDNDGYISLFSAFSQSKNRLQLYSGCNVNFYAGYTVSGTTADWTNLGTANFYNTATVTSTTDIKFKDINIMPSASTTFASAGGGAITVNGNLLINLGATFTASKSFELNGYFTNNGTFSAGAVTITMNGANVAINGTTSTTFPTIQVGKTSGSNDVILNISTTSTIGTLVVSKANKNRSVVIGNSRTLTVTGNATLNQPGKDNYASWINVGNNTLNVNGNLIFVGTNNGTKRICRIDVLAGSFTLDGTITWMSNNAVVTEVIGVTSGTITFNSSITQGDKSGTIKVTSSGNINFYGSSAPSLTFGGGTTPVFTTASGSTIRFSKGLTCSKALTFARGCNVKFLSSGTFTPTTTTAMANMEIDSGVTLTAGGNFNVSGNWVNRGTFVPGTHTVTFSGTGVQTISKTSGTETFYGLATSSASGTVKLEGDVMVTNTMNMAGAKIDLNNYTLTLGNSAGASLTRTSGQVYGGTFKRWWPTSSITPTSGNNYGLFPVGSSSTYRPLSITSTSNPTTAGYVSAVHNHAVGVIPVTYTDNGGSNIEAVTEMSSVVSTTGLAGGTYTVEVKFTGLGAAGSVANLKLVTCTTDTIMGSYGTHVTTTGTVASPTVKRTGVSQSNLNNRWVIGTNDKNATPLYRYVYSRKSGNWNDASGTGTWSYTSGGSGAACSCLPTSSGYAVIYAGHTIDVTVSDSVAYVDVLSGGILDVKIPRTLNVGGNLTLEGTGTLNSNGTLRVAGELTLASSTSVTGDIVVMGTLTVPSGVTLTHTSGSLTLSGDVEVNGELAINSSVSFVMSGSGTEIFGSGSITTTSGGTISITNFKSIRAGSELTFGSPSVSTTVAIGNDGYINNMGDITVYGNITGGNANSTWLNNSNSRLDITGILLSTGVLDVETGPNTVNYSGSGAQTIKVPYSAYYILQASNAGTKSIAADVQVDSLVRITDAAVIDEGAHILWGTGGLAMSGTAQLLLDRTTDEYLAPELSGDYELLGGEVIITQTGDSVVVAPATYYNLTLQGSHAFDVSGVVAVTNNLQVLDSAFLNSTGNLVVYEDFIYNTSGTTTITDSITIGTMQLSAGTFNADVYAINVTGAGGWNRTGGTFNAGSGILHFTGPAVQQINDVAATMNLHGLGMNKSAGTLSTTGSLRQVYITGDVDLTRGNFDGSISLIDTIYMRGGSWINDSATFTPGDIVIVFDSTTDQAIQGLAHDQTFRSIVVNKASGSVVVGGSTSTLTIYGGLHLAAGTFNEGTAQYIYIGGNLRKNSSATFTPTSGTVVFNGSGAQQIMGSATAHTFHHLTVDKTGGKLSVAGSATAVTVNGNITLNTDTFEAGTAADIYVAGDWTAANGKFSPGTGTVHFNGSGAQNINGSATNYNFYNLIVNNGGATLAFDNNDTMTLGGQLTFTSGRLFAGTNSTIQLLTGNWTNNGGTFLPSTGSVIFSNTSANQYINGTASTQSFNNLKISKAGQSLIVDGSIATINVSGDYELLAGTFDKGTASNINIGGNFINSGTFTQGTGTVTFNGSGAQAISGSTTTTFNNLTINKSGDNLTLNRAVNVNAALDLTSGNIVTSAANILALGASATSNEGSAASFVAGPIKKTGNTNFVFPIGKGTKWRRAGVSDITTVTTELTAEYFDTPYSDTVTVHGGLVKPGSREYWDIDRTVTSDAVKIRLYWEDAAASGIHNCDFLTIAHWKNSRWEEEPAVADGGSVCSGAGAGSIVTTGTVASFSPFGFGSLGGGSLPVKLTDLSAKAVAKTIKLEWTTATEVNNKGFELERSTDGEHFSNIGWVSGNGTTTETISYSFDDKNVLANTVYYYRLRQIDFDGASEYTKMVSASTTENVTGEFIWSRFIPNPAKEEANLVMNVNAEGRAFIEIYSSFGQKVFEANYNIYHGLNDIQLDLSNLPAGNYITEIQLNGIRKSVRLVRE